MEQIRIHGDILAYNEFTIRRISTTNRTIHIDDAATGKFQFLVELDGICGGRCTLSTKGHAVVSALGDGGICIDGHLINGCRAGECDFRRRPFKLQTFQINFSANIESIETHSIARPVGSPHQRQRVITKNATGNRSRGIAACRLVLLSNCAIFYKGDFAGNFNIATIAGSTQCAIFMIARPKINIAGEVNMLIKRVAIS